MEQIILKHSDILYTTEPDIAFYIESGEVLVYLVPYKAGKAGRRLFLYQGKPGETLPSFSWCDEKSGDWKFAFTALEKAVLRKEEGSKNHERIQKAQMEFSKKAGLPMGEDFGFQERVVECYNINLIKEEGCLYATSLEQHKTHEEGLHLIENMFRKKTEAQMRSSGGSECYDSVSRICDYLKIPIASYELIKEKRKRKLTLEDIARFSHFGYRKVILEKDWYKKDGGPILAYREKVPIACLPRKPGKYVAYDPKKNEAVPVTRIYADSLELEGEMIYRPFREEKMTGKALAKFCMECVYRQDILCLGLMTLLGTGLALMLPALNQYLFDNLIPMWEATALIQLCLLVMACELGRFCFEIAGNFALYRTMNGIKYAVQNAIYHRMFYMPPEFFRKYESADLAQRAMGIAVVFKKLADEGIRAVLNGIFSLIFLISMFGFSGSLALPACSTVILITAAAGGLVKKLVTYQNQEMEQNGILSSRLYQFIRGISKIKIAGIEDRVLLEYLKPYAENRELVQKRERLNLKITVILESGEALALLAVFFKFSGGEMGITSGAFAGFLSVFTAFSAAVTNLVLTAADISDLIPAYQRCRPILENLPEYETGSYTAGSLAGDIEVNNLTFAYDQESGDVLKNISFHIKAGEYVGIVGSSGCGKSTLMRILTGLDSPVKGRVFYDGRGIESMDKKELRKKMGIVLQDGQLFNGSIYDNICATASGATLKQAEKVMEQVGMTEEISEMPMGLHTVMTESGNTVSGGQKQRILIARAIIGKPKILFFDEATSALDNRTQKKISDTLKGMKATRIVIAHRLSTVMECDRILVMDDGRIVEEGSYQELMKEKGVFYQMASRQLA